MRHRVFLAVLLSLVLSLSKVSSQTRNATTTTPPEPATPTSNASSETSNATTTTPTEPATPTSNASSETSNATTTTPPEPATPTSNASSETSNATTTTPPEPATPTSNASSETSNATTTTPPEPATPTANASSETSNATTTTPPEPATPTSNASSETSNATTTTPPEPATPTSNASSETSNATTTTPPEPATPTANASSETSNATTTTPPEPATPTSNAGDFCQKDPCGNGLATCVSLNSNFTCVCQYGFYYDSQNCHRGKIFPGVITLKYTLSDSVLTLNSVEYEVLLQNVTEFFKDAFQNLPGYKQTVIVEIQLAKEFRNAPSMGVTVTNLFEENSDVNNDTVTSAIETAAQQSSSFISQYTATTYCAAFKCDDLTTVCEESEFPKCKCKENFTMTEWDDHSCSGCSEDCSAEEKKYCVKEEGIPTCKCIVNFQEKNGKCVACPVGYSGENCNNNRELILIIVGTVFGAIILGLVTAISIISIRSKHKQDPEKKSLIRSGYANPNTTEERQSTMFPRVQTTSGHTNPGYQPNNPYEARSSNRGPFPARDYDDLYETSREPEGFRMQRRY